MGHHPLDDHRIHPAPLELLRHHPAVCLQVASGELVVRVVEKPHKTPGLGVAFLVAGQPPHHSFHRQVVPHQILVLDELADEGERLFPIHGAALSSLAIARSWRYCSLAGASARLRLQLSALKLSLGA